MPEEKSSGKISKGKLVIRAPKKAEMEQYSEYLRPSFPKWKMFVAVYDGRVVGYCQCGVEDRKGKILSVWAKSDFRKKGIGKKLLGKAHSYFTKIGVRSIFALPLAGVEDFYVKAGYTKTNRLSSRKVFRMPPKPRRR